MRFVSKRDCISLACVKLFKKDSRLGLRPETRHSLGIAQYPIVKMTVGQLRAAVKRIEGNKQFSSV